VKRLVDDLNHAHVAVGIVGVDNLGDPTQPLERTDVVVVVVEVGIGVVLARERLVGNLSARAAVETR
jgi:hypothetical protein